MPDSTIRHVHARRVWDSRGRPTVEAEVTTAGGAVGRAIAPAGASTGSGEAVDRRDGGTAFGGLDVRGALAAIRDEIAPAIAGMDAAGQAALDARLIELDGTANKARLGGNATIAVSMAAAHAAAAAHGLPLWRWLAGDAADGPVVMPLPEIQIFGGGAHADARVDLQDFMVVCPGAENFAQALDWTAEVYRAAGALMAAAGKRQGVADEGGWWPVSPTTRRRSRRWHSPSSGRGSAPASRWRSRSMSPPPSSAVTGPIACAWTSATTTVANGPSGSPAGSPATRSSRSRTRWPRTTRPAWPR